MAVHRMKAPVIHEGYTEVDDSLRRAASHDGRGRGVSPLTQALLDGKTCQIEEGQSLPDKTLRKNGLRLRYYTNEDGSKVVWAEPLEG